MGWRRVALSYHPEEALRRHIYVVGKTGTGKTSLLKTVFLQLVGAWQGGCDPRPSRRPRHRTPRSLAAFARRHASSTSIRATFPSLSHGTYSCECRERTTDRGRLPESSPLSRTCGAIRGGLASNTFSTTQLVPSLTLSTRAILGLPRMLVDSHAYRHWVVRQIKDPFREIRSGKTSSRITIGFASAGSNRSDSK